MDAASKPAHSTHQPSWQAKLARWCVRAAWGQQRGGRLAFLIVLLLVTGVCAVWGAILRFDEAQAPLSLGAKIFDLVYAPFLYIVPQPDFAFASKLNLPETVARITGPLIPLVGLFWLLRRRLLSAAAQFLLGHGAAGFSVIVGESGSGDALALASAATGEIVVLCDCNQADDEDRLATLGSAGVLCVSKVPERLQRAASVTIWRASDTDNIAQAIALRSTGQLAHGDLHLAVQARALQHALLQAPDIMLEHGVRLRPHSLAGKAMRDALATIDLSALAREKGQQRVTLCLWGDGDALGWAAEIALRQYWSVQLGAPHLLLVGKSDENAQDKVLAHFGKFAPEVFGEDDFPKVEFISREDALARSDVTCHLVDCGDVDGSAQVAFSLAADLAQASADPAPVCAVLNADSAIVPVFATSKLAFRDPILLGVATTLEALRARPQDEQAAQIHMAYAAKFGGENVPASGRWQDLEENYVAANRAAADHVAMTHWDAATSGPSGDALNEALARAEHCRWSAERLLSGWAPAHDGVRDNARRLHPDLKPWEALGEEQRAKDRDQVCEVIGEAITGTDPDPAG